MGLTNFAAVSLLAGDPLPTTLWMKLHSGDPGADATLAACSQTDRESITLEPDAVLANTATNDAPAAWTGNPANETASHYSLWDAETAGNPWIVGELAPVIDLVITGGATVAAGAVILTFTVHGG